MQIEWQNMGGKLLQKGVDSQLSDMLYRTVIQAVLLVRLDSWALSYATIKAVEGTHVGFLHHITGKLSRRQAYREW